MTTDNQAVQTEGGARSDVCTRSDEYVPLTVKVAKDGNAESSGGQLGGYRICRPQSPSSFHCECPQGCQQAFLQPGLPLRINNNGTGIVICDIFVDVIN